MPTRSKALAAVIFVLALLATGVAGYLTWTTFNATQVAGCTGDAGLDCDSVLSSQWAKLLGVPVSLFGAVSYLLIAFLTWPAAMRKPRWAPTMLFALSMLAAGSGLWFIGLQVLMVKSFCIYCLAVHTCGLVIFVLTLLLVIGSREERELGYWLTGDRDFLDEGLGLARTFLAACGIAAAGMATLMLGQVLAPPPAMTLETNVEFAELAEPEESSEMPVAEERPEPEEPDFESEGEEGEIVPDVVVTDDTTEDEPEPLPETLEGSTTLEEDEDLFAEFDEFGTDSAVEDDSTDEEEAPEFVRPEREKRLMKFQGLRTLLDVRGMPMVGNAEGKHVVVEMVDYTCSHCRHLHKFIPPALERYDELAFVVYHTPLGKPCNRHVTKENDTVRHACDYARLAIGVWLLEPKKFNEFHHYLMAGEKPPNVFEARQRARELVGDELFLDEALQGELTKRLRSQTDSWVVLKQGLPIIMLDRGYVRGTPQTESQWFSFLEDNLGMSAGD